MYRVLCLLGFTCKGPFLESPFCSLREPDSQFPLYSVSEGIDSTVALISGILSKNLQFDLVVA